MLQEEEEEERVQKKVQSNNTVLNKASRSNKDLLCVQKTCRETSSLYLRFSTTERTEKFFSVTVSSVFSTMN